MGQLVLFGRELFKFNFKVNVSTILKSVMSMNGVAFSMKYTSNAQQRGQRAWGRTACVAGLAAVLAGAGAFGPWTQAAYAASAQTEAELAQLTAQVQEAAAQHSEAVSAMSDLDAQISEQATEIVRIEQEVIPEQRDRASQAAANLYKMGESSSSIITMLFSSNSFSDLLTQVKYLTVIQDANVRELEDLEQTRADLNEQMAELSAKRDQVNEQQQKAEQALASVSEAQAAMQARANSEDAAEAEAARQAAEAAAAVQQQMQQASGNTSTGSSTSSGDTGSSAPSQQQPAEEEPSQPSAPSQPAEEEKPEETPDSGSNDAGGWLSGVASHYGTGDGLMGSMTASGDVVTETSMGIAMLNVPLGTYVEIRYNGRSCVAVVNDRGPYIHGRVIDMQPAVARALGFLSVGVGTVEYRFL